MGKKNVIRPYASVVIVRILCWIAIACGIGLIVFEFATAKFEDPEGFFLVLTAPYTLGGLGLIVGACVVMMLTNVVEDLKTLRINEYGIQKKTQEFRNEVLTRMHNLEQESIHMIQQQDKLLERLEEIGEKPERKTEKSSARRGVRIAEPPKEDETDYELDLH
jgi:hypothetical protein